MPEKVTQDELRDLKLAQEQLAQAQSLLLQAEGAYRWETDRLSRRHALKEGDRIDTDGTILRAEAPVDSSDAPRNGAGEVSQPARPARARTG